MSASAPAALVAAMLALVPGVVGAAGCSSECERVICPDEVTDASPDSPWDIEQAFALPGGKLVEAWVAMSAGSELTVEFESSPRPVTWEIHSHVGNVVTEHDVGIDAAGSLVFVAPEDNDFFVLFVNRGDLELSMTVRILLADGDRFVEWL